MKRIATLALLLLLPSIAQAQLAFSVSTNAPNTYVIDTRGYGPFVARLAAIPASSGVSTCNVQIDGSSDSVSWGSADVLASQSCTSRGAFISAATAANWIRLNITALSGGGSVQFNLNIDKVPAINTAQAVPMTFGKLNGTEIVDGVRNTTIQQAINRFPSGNGTVVIPTNFTITSGLSISSSQANTTILCTNGAIITKGANMDLLAVAGNFFTLRDCILDGVQTSFTGGAINLTSVTDFTIEHNQFRNFKDSLLYGAGAISLSGASNGTIYNNRMTSINAAGIFGRANSHRNKIIHNFIDTTLSNGLLGASDIAFHAVTAGTSTDKNRVIDNQILHGGASFCIEVGDFGGNPALQTEIVDNTCTFTVANSLGGISLGATVAPGNNHPLVLNNTIDANGFLYTVACIEANLSNYPIVAHNECKLGTQSNTGIGGIFCDPCSNGLFDTNTVAIALTGTNQSAIWYTNSTTAAFSNDSWVNNTADLTGSTSATSAYRAQCNNASATCNNLSFTNNTAIGVNLAGDAGVRLQRSSGTMTGSTAGPNNLINFNAAYNLDSGTATAASFPSGLNFVATTFASLGTPANGTVVFCSDCNATCSAGASTGRTCFRENGAWTH